MKKPFLILIDGPIGSGKSTIAKLLQKKLKETALIDLDMIKHFVYDINEKNNIKYVSLASDVGKAMVEVYFQNYVNVIVEKAFTKAEYIKDFIELAKKHKIKYFVYQIEVPLDLMIKRVKERPVHWGAKKRVSTKKIKTNISNYSRYKYQGATVLDSSKLTPQQIVNKIIKDID